MNARRLSLPLFAVAALALAASPVAAQNRSETVAGWRIGSGGSGDGGYVARLSRRGRGYSLEHRLEFWRGNGGVAISASFRRGDCRSGDAGGIVPFDEGMSRAAFDRRLADYLRECPLPRAEDAVLRRTLDLAWPRFAAAARRARSAMEAQIDAIVRHGEQR